ncbi:MAG: uridine kinase, partial [Hyphomonadaceae bacterium]
MSFIVAIAGGSGAGKSTIAAALAERLGARAALIAEDDYYICRTAFAAFDETTHDFDRPEAKDHALLAAHLAHARRGEAFEKPVYRHADH